MSEGKMQKREVGTTGRSVPTREIGKRLHKGPGERLMTGRKPGG